MKATLYKQLSNAKTEIKITSGVALKHSTADIDLENAIIIVNGKICRADYAPKEGDIITIRLTPSATGLLVTAIVVGVIALGAAIAGGIYAYKARLAAKRAQEELDRMKKLTNRSDIDNRPFLRGASNTLATGNSQPYICGRHFFTPYLLCNPFYQITGTDGATQYTYTALECGFNSQILRTMSIDDIIIKTFSDTSPQEGVYTLDTGVFAENGLVEISQDGGLLEALPMLNYRVASSSRNDEVPKDYDVNEGTKQYLTYTLDPYAKDVDIAISFPYGLYAMKDDGTIIEHQVRITPQYSLDGGNSWTEFTFDNNGSQTTMFRRDVSTRELRYVAHRDFTLSDYTLLKLNGQDAIYIRIRSNGNRDSMIHNDCYCLYYQSVCFDPAKSSAPAGVLQDGGAAGLVPCKTVEDRERAFCTIAGLRLKASQLNEDKLKKINIVTQGVARVWNGSAWSAAKTATRNPAAWALEIETSPCHPASRRDDSELDLESYGEFYQYCEQNAFYFDYVVTQGIRKDDLLNYIMEATGACVYYDIYGRRAIAIDCPQENAIAVYNPQNIINIQNKKTFGRRTDGLRIKYVNSKNDTYQEDTYLVMREVDGAPLPLTYDSIIKDVPVTGITTYEHVVKYARRLMAIEALRPKTTVIEVGNEGVFYTPFSKVLIQDDSLKIGLASATIRECAWWGGLLQKIYLNGKVYFDPAKRHGVIINCFTAHGAMPVAAKVEGEGETDVLEVVSQVRMSADAVPEPGNVLSFGLLDADGEFSRITTPYLISNIKRADRGFTLELVNYNEAVYDTGSIPPYSSNITQKRLMQGNTIPADIVTHEELAKAVAAIDPSGSDAAQEAANVVTHGIHFTNVHRIHEMQLSLEEVLAKIDDDAKQASASISMSEEEILLKVENVEKALRAFIAIRADEILAEVDDLDRELTGKLDVQAGAIQAFVQGGGAQGRMSLSLELPAVVDASTRAKLVAAGGEQLVSSVYATIAGTEFYGLRGDTSNAVVKSLWDKAVAANLIASQIDLTATQINMAAEHVVITGDTNKGQTIIEGGYLRTKLIEVEKLLAQSITMRNGGSMQSENFRAGSAGWRIGSDGSAEFDNATIRGTVYASNGSFSGTINATSGNMTNVNATGGTFTNITASGGTFNNVSINSNCTLQGLNVADELKSINGLAGTVDSHIDEIDDLKRRVALLEHNVTMLEAMANRGF